MKYKYVFLLLFAWLSCSFSNCGGEKDCRRSYYFQLPFNLTPQIDTFNIGDTIWVIAEFANEMMDLNSNNSYTLGDFNFYSECTIIEIGTNPFQDATFEFEIIEDQGSLNFIQLVNASSIQINYLYSGDRYFIKFGLIPSKEGLFEFILTSLLPNVDTDFVIIPNCNETFEINYLMNNGENNNYEFVQLSSDLSIQTTTKDVFDSYGSYCFYVVE